MTGYPAERLAVDILGPLPLTERGNKYILMVGDYFTKWMEAFPKPNQEAETVAGILVKEYVCRYGVPLILHSDQGRNFESSVMKEMCELLGIKKTHTTPYHPQSDGMIERFNRTLEAQLSKFVDYNQHDWDTHIPLLLLAYRSAVHESTRCTPAKMTFGRDLRLPIDLVYGRPEERPSITTSKFCQDLMQRLECIHEYARENLKVKSNSMKEKYDVLAQSKPLNVGDAVWLHNPRRKKGLSPKLNRPWEGPYTVTKKINDIVYRVQLTANTKPKVVHRNRLWAYNGSNAPSWFRPPSLVIEKAKESKSYAADDTGSMLLVENGSRRSERLQKKKREKESKEGRV